MDDKDLPYFFTETLATREELTERQRTLTFTLEDLNWLDAVFLANNTARMAQEPAMKVETLHLNTCDGLAVELAGAFMMSPAPDGGTFLYTPCRGLEKFDNTSKLTSELSAWLKAPKQREALFHYLSIAQRTSLGTSDTLTLTTQSVTGAVFEEQQRTLQRNRQSNVQGMLQELGLTSSFTSMLDQAIGSALAARFPGLNQRETRVTSHATETSQTPNDTKQPTTPSTTRSLRETVLAYFVNDGWPVAESRHYSHADRTLDPDQPSHDADDQLHWEQSVQKLGQGLKEHIKLQLAAFWNTASQSGVSRLEYVATAMSDTFRACLLDQQQQALISTKDTFDIQALSLNTLTPAASATQAIRAQRAMLGDSATTFVELAGTFVISPTEDGTAAQIILYTPTDGLKYFPALKQLESHLMGSLNSPKQPDKWMNYLSRAQRYFDINPRCSTITTSPLSGAIFPHLVRVITEKQVENLEYGLDLYRQSQGMIDIDALIDHLLDVRSMIDPQLIAQTTSGRWGTQLAASWQPAPVPAQTGQSVLEAASTQQQKLESLKTELENILASRPSLHRSAAALLNVKLSAWRKHFSDAPTIFVNTYESTPAKIENRTPTASINLVEHFLKRLCREAEPFTDSLNSGVFSVASGGTATKVTNLTVPALNALIETALSAYPNYLRQMHKLYPNMQPLIENALTSGLKAEAELRTLNQSMHLADQTIILTVLDSYKRETRRSLNGFRPDAFSLTLKSAEPDVQVALGNCFLLTERGGQDPNHSGKAIFWSPALGFEIFTSLTTFKTALNERLLEPDERITLLENLPGSESMTHRVYSLGALELIEDKLVSHQYQRYTEQQSVDIEQLLSVKLSALQLQNLWQIQITQSLAPTNLERAIAIARALSLQHSLPEWLANADVQDKQLHVELLEQYRNSVDTGQDYLHGIDSLAHFTLNKLATLLQSLDSQSSVTADLIEVTLTTDNGSAERPLTLVDYALSHIDDSEGRTPTFVSLGSELLSPQQDAETLKTRIQELRIGEAYQAYLRPLLTTVTPQLLERQTRFAKQLPWQLMQHAHAQFLKKELTATAFGYVQQIMDMPDSIARAAVFDTTATIRPLELLTSTDATAVKAQGIYLISPASGGEGPHVLLAPYSQTHDLKEYPDEASLLTELKTSGPLQTWMLRCIPYAAQAAMTASLSPTNAAITSLRLASNPITGPLFKQMFTDNVQLLLMLLGTQATSGAQTLWNLAKDVFKSSVYEGVFLLAAKLTYPWIVWQSYTFFKASADELQEHHWTNAMEYFVKGVAQMVRLWQSMPATAGPMSSSSETEAVSTWPVLDITAPERTRLLPYEVTDLSLHELTKVDSLGLYQSSQKRYYAPVEGKVFEVEKRKERWYIISALGIGPAIVRNTRHQWMSSRTPFRQGRRVISRLANQFHSNPIARQGMNIQASGMQAIRTLYPKRSAMITEALALATYYAKNAKENLRLITSLPQPTTRCVTVIKEFFGLTTITSEQLRIIRYVVDKVLDALSAPTLTAADSIQFVVGSSRLKAPTGTDLVMAFTVIPDTNKIIYLTQEFFKPQLEYADLLVQPFYVNVHARATTLIHELTHHALATEDIAYLDASHPFPDLLKSNTTANERAALERRQRASLSLTTPFDELFQVLDLKTWTTIDPKEELLQHVLTITGSHTLDNARRVFQSDPLKRIKVVLSNADSVALLITQLGRQRDPSPVSSVSSP